MRNGNDAVPETPAADTATALIVSEEPTWMALVATGLAAVGVLPSTV